jgi:alkyl sulfatase BDS1-like metallo-beta-lactamase superfamily hydrolase
LADPRNDDAKSALAEVYRRLGRGQENGTWRNFYLTGALELTRGVVHGDEVNTAAMATALTVE